MRCYCVPFAEHLGLDEDLEATQIALKDPVCSATYNDLWRQTAQHNTDLCDVFFPEMPSNRHRTITQFNICREMADLRLMGEKQKQEKVKERAKSKSKSESKSKSKSKEDTVGITTTRGESSDIVESNHGVRAEPVMLTRAHVFENLSEDSTAHHVNVTTAQHDNNPQLPVRRRIRAAVPNAENAVPNVENAVPDVEIQMPMLTRCDTMTEDRLDVLTKQIRSSTHPDLPTLDNAKLAMQKFKGQLFMFPLEFLQEDVLAGNLKPDDTDAEAMIPVKTFL